MQIWRQGLILKYDLVSKFVYRRIMLPVMLVSESMQIADFAISLI